MNLLLRICLLITTVFMVVFLTTFLLDANMLGMQYDNNELLASILFCFFVDFCAAFLLDAILPISRKPTRTVFKLLWFVGVVVSFWWACNETIIVYAQHGADDKHNFVLTVVYLILHLSMIRLSSTVYRHRMLNYQKTHRFEIDCEMRKYSAAVDIAGRLAALYLSGCNILFFHFEGSSTVIHTEMEGLDATEELNCNALILYSGSVAQAMLIQNTDCFPNDLLFSKEFISSHLKLTETPDEQSNYFDTENVENLFNLCFEIYYKAVLLLYDKQEMIEFLANQMLKKADWTNEDIQSVFLKLERKTNRKAQIDKLFT